MIHCSCCYCVCSPPTALCLLSKFEDLTEGDVVVQNFMQNGATSTVGQVSSRGAADAASGAPGAADATYVLLKSSGAGLLLRSFAPLLRRRRRATPG